MSFSPRLGSRRGLTVALGLLAFLILSADAFASASCKTRSRCRTFSKQFVAKAKVRCSGQAFSLCSVRSASCGTANATCGWQSCPQGGAEARAVNGFSGCFLTGSRMQQGRYGEFVADPDPAGIDGEGAHDLISRVEFLDGEAALLHLDELAMSSTLDTSYSRVDVIAYIETEEGANNDEADFPPERIVWTGYLHLQDGTLLQKGFDAEVEDYLGREGLTELFLHGVTKRIPFDGTDDEFDRLAVDVVVDGGQSDRAK